MKRHLLRLAAGLAAFIAASAPAHVGGLIESPTPSAATIEARALQLPLWVGPAHSGSWFDPTRSGEGFTLQILDDGSALAVWFTYPPAGSAARQAWIIAQGGRIDGDRIHFETVLTTRGPRFGPGYDPAQLQVIPWGSLDFQFFDCNSGQFSYTGPLAWGSGTRSIVRLTALSELECSGKRLVGSNGARTLAGLQQRSGGIFDVSHNGEGWMLEELADGHALVYWFTYDDSGEQAWTIGIADSSGPHVVVGDNLQPMGTHFGAAFDPAQVVSQHWGQLQIDFDGCDRGVASYQSGVPAFGSGTLHPVRLSRLAGNSCIEGAPTVPVGTWSAATTMPAPPQSEVALAVIGNRAWIAGGLSTPTVVKSYDLDADAWSVAADLPGGRDHALGVAFGGNVYVAGGNRTTPEGEQSVPGWRYYPAENRWEDVPQLPDVAQSAATTLNGYAYFGSPGGTIVQLNTRTLASRRIPPDPIIARDHSQLVAFQGELWMMGGRDGNGVEHARVSIFDPASETWRAGPLLQNSRAGFAAAASSTLLMVAGGERIAGQKGVLNSAEAIVPGAQFWTALPTMPIAAHGVVGVLYKNAFFTLGGSLQAATELNHGDVQVFRWGP